MLIQNIHEASLIRANYLLSQEKTENSLNFCSQELNSISKILGIEFDKGIYTLIFDQLDFKDPKQFKNLNSIKSQYFLKIFPKDIQNEKFVNFLSEILMRTRNNNSAKEIFETLNTIMELSDEEQLKIILAFILSKNPNYYKDAMNLMHSKVKKMQEKDLLRKIEPHLSQDILSILSNKKNGHVKNNINLHSFKTLPKNEDNKKEKKSDSLKLLSILETENMNQENNLIPIEKLYEDLGPSFFNECKNIIPNSPIIDNKIDAKGIAELIMTIMKKSPFIEDKEIRIMNKSFLRSLDLEDEAEKLEESSDKLQIDWNIDNFYKVYKNKIDAINPNDIFKYFDSPLFNIKDKKKFELFINILKTFEIIKNNNFEPFFEFIFKKWNNEVNQIEFLKYLVSNPHSENFSFKNYKGKRTKQHFELNFSISKSSNSYLMEPWYCISLIEVLLEISHGNNYIKVKELFNWPIQNIPEIIALGLIQITKKSNDFLYDELIQEVLTLFLNNHMNSFSVIEEIWNTNKEIVISAIANMYNSSPDLISLSRILDITQKLKESLLLLVDYSDYKFAVNLAILAVKRDFLHIENWLKERIQTVGDDFVLALLDYLKENLINQCKGNIKSKDLVLEKSQLSIESLGVILENLCLAKHSNNPKISITTEELVEETYKTIYSTFNELNIEQVNGKEIEERANQIFQRMFKGETEVLDTIETLKILKVSQTQVDRETYACMIHCLLDEYRFYHQYPEKQLNIISTLFGQIINNKLIDGVIQTIALKYVLEGIKKGNGPLFIFGTKALEQFKDQLHEFPSYTKSLVETKQLKNDPLLYEAVSEKYNAIFASNEDPTNNLLAAAPNPGMNINGTGNLIAQQSIFPPLSAIKTVSALNSNNNTLQDIQNLKNKIYPNASEGNNCPPGIKSNQRPINQNEGNSFNSMIYNLNNNKNSSPEQFFGLNNMGRNINPNNIPINQQIIQNGIGQNISEMMNNQIPNINIMSNNSGNNIDNSQMYLNNQNNEQLNNLKNQNIPINPNNMLGNHINPINDQQIHNVEEQEQKRQKIRMESGKNLSNILPRGNNNNFNAQNNSLMEIFGNNEMDHKIQSSNIILDKMRFIFNQLGENNIKDKANEIKQLCNNNDNLYHQFSDFLVKNRIIREENNHDLYFKLVTQIDYKELINFQINDTIKYIHKILNIGQKQMEDINERNIMKNLGNWLGKLTLSRNKPILAKDLDFRDLLLMAFETGKLNVIVPFTTKILANSINSKVFTLKNPWMRAILGILNQIVNTPGLRNNIIFDIKDLFKKLNVTDDIIEHLNNSFLEGKIPNKNSPDFNNNYNQILYQNNNQQLNQNPSTFMKHTPYEAQKPIPKNQTLVIQDEQQQNLLKKDLYNQIGKSNFLLELVNIFEEGKIFEQKILDKNQILPSLYKIMNESINNIITPVIERAVNISLVTTKELVIKDFQYESDEKKFIMATTNFIKSLAGALASVTCKEPLRMSFTKRMKDYMMEKNLDIKVQEEVAKMKYTNDFLNIGCNYIFSFVQKKAAENVLQDETIIKEIERRKAVDANGTKLFSYEANSALTKIVNKLPPILKPNKKGLTKEQLLLYNNFPIFTGSPGNSELTKINAPIVRDILRILKEVMDNSINVRSYDICMQNVKTIITNNSNQMGNEFEEGSEELKLCEKAIMENKIKEMNLSEQDEAKSIQQMTALTLKYVYKAFETQNKKLLNIFISFLQGWVKSTGMNVKKEITDKLLLNCNNAMCFNLGFHLYLINLELLDLNEYQTLIINHLEGNVTRQYFIKFINDLKKLKINDSSNPSSIKLPKLYDFYYNEEKCNKYFTLFGKRCKLPNDLNLTSEPTINYKICNIKDQKTYQVFINMCYFAFTKIVNTKYPFQRIEPNDLTRILGNFIQSPFINNEEQLNVFSMIITELCIKKLVNGNTTDNYPDSESRCIYTLFMSLPQSLNKLKMFTTMLNGIFKTFHYDYMKSILSFNQRPYFKLFYNFIAFFRNVPNNAKIFNSENTKIQYMALIAQFLKFLSPQYYPGFALAWLELISSEVFMSCFLGDINTQTVQNKEKNDKITEYLALVSEIFIFLKNCSNKQVNKVFMNYLYKFIYLLSNTYPEFITEYDYIMLISLPHENIYIQLKNLLLSATPKKLEQFKSLDLENKDLENEIKENNFGDNNVKTLLDIIGILNKYNIIPYLEKYIENPNIEIVKNICDNLNKNNNKTFNFYVIQGLVIYYGQNGFSKIKNTTEAYNFFYDMMKLLDTDNRNMLIISLLNELKFPSKQTLYFVLIIIHILTIIKNEEIEEVIITLLLERLFVKPIPWGIELLFKKLLHGDKYDLMKTNFFKNLNGGEWLINSIKEFMEDKKFVKFTKFRDNKIDMILSKEKKKNKNDRKNDNDGQNN